MMYLRRACRIEFPLQLTAPSRGRKHPQWIAAKQLPQNEQCQTSEVKSIDLEYLKLVVAKRS